MFKQISSTQNTYIKELFQLKEKSRLRKKIGQFLIEGFREISLAIKGNYKISTLLFDETIISKEKIEVLISEIKTNIEVIQISNDVYKKLAYRATTEGVIAISNVKNLELDTLILPDNPLVLIAEAPEKPGNIGALLRTADAAGIDAVIIANPKTDMYNPNIIRSSVGCVFTNQIATGTTSEIISFLKAKNIEIYCAALTASVDYSSINYTKASAIVVGTEATGLSNEWLKNSTKNIIIPMRGKIDSMNVSVSAAIITFEAVRQRDTNN
ncbi:RNA methyltransferase [Lutibacter sp. TH_r2]|uniref:TrmH family RNA methyltransferase n=1 Tax=Lutibacter sp. TH_r2 TaxID=3082083 RepID=UPI002954EEF7|nr:RNA methyltransferase [Lutibacter sp. TH_r2]MDV7187569.1 RNA methyltransferase [Lutibacter sp. TH_r2]